MSAAAPFRVYLDQAHAAIGGGEAQEGERLAKAISALVRAERDVAEYLNERSAATELDDEETTRAELLRRLALFDDADRAGSPRDVLARIAATGVAS